MVEFVEIKNLKLNINSKQIFFFQNLKVVLIGKMILCDTQYKV